MNKKSVAFVVGITKLLKTVFSFLSTRQRTEAFFAGILFLFLCLVLLITTWQVQVTQQSEGRAEVKSGLFSKTIELKPKPPKLEIAARSFTVFGYVRDERILRQGVSNVRVIINRRGNPGVFECLPVATDATGRFSSFCDGSAIGSDDFQKVRVTITIPGSYASLDARCCDDGNCDTFGRRNPSPGNSCNTISLSQVEYNYSSIKNQNGPVVFILNGPPGPTPLPTSTPVPAGCSQPVPFSGGQSYVARDYSVNMGAIAGNFRFSFQNYEIPDMVEVYSGLLSDPNTRLLFSTKSYYPEIPYNLPPNPTFAPAPIENVSKIMRDEVEGLNFRDDNDGIGGVGNRVFLQFNYYPRSAVGSDLEVLARYINSGTGWQSTYFASGSGPNVDLINTTQTYSSSGNYRVGGAWVVRDLRTGQVRTVMDSACLRIFDKETKSFGTTRVTIPSGAGAITVTGSKTYIGYVNGGNLSGNNNGFLPLTGWRVNHSVPSSGGSFVRGASTTGSWTYAPANDAWPFAFFGSFPNNPGFPTSINYSLVPATFSSGQGAGAYADFNASNLTIYSRDQDAGVCPNLSFPTCPNVTAVCNSSSNNRIDLSWDRISWSGDNYKVSRDGVPIANATWNSFADNNAVCGVEHSYSVNPKNFTPECVQNLKITCPCTAPTLTPTPALSDWGFVSGSNAVVLPYRPLPSSNNKITVKIYSPLGTTAWNFLAECPSATLTITPIPTIPAEAVPNVGVYADSLSILDDQNKLAFGKGEGTIDFLIKPRVVQWPKPPLADAYGDIITRLKNVGGNESAVYTLNLYKDGSYWGSDSHIYLKFYKNNDSGNSLSIEDTLPGGTLSHISLLKRNLADGTHQVEIWVNGVNKGSKIYSGTDFGDEINTPDTARFATTYHNSSYYGHTYQYLAIIDEIRISKKVQPVNRDYYTEVPDSSVAGLWHLNGIENLNNSGGAGYELPASTCSYNAYFRGYRCGFGNNFAFIPSGDSLMYTCSPTAPGCRPTVYPPSP